MNRWNATLKYRSETGPIEETHEVEEMSEIRAIVEATYNWDRLIELRVERINHSVSKSLTVEAAAEL